MMSTQPEKMARYMIAITPPEPLYSEIQELKLLLQQQYNTSAAVRRPPHITLLPPFDAPLAKEQQLADFLDAFCATFEPIELKLDGFGEFHGSTVFIRPVPNPAIRELQKKLSKEFAKVHHRIDRGPSYAFEAHITIAYQDLSRPMFEALWREYADKIFRRTFMIDRLHLLKNMMGWKTVHTSIMSRTPAEEPLMLF